MLATDELQQKNASELIDIISSLRAEVTNSQEIIAEKDSLISAKESTISQNKKTISYLVEQLKLGRHQRFGKSSERDEDHPQKSLFDEAGINETPDAINEDDRNENDAETQVSSHARKKRARQPLPGGLKRIEVIHDLSDAEKQCPCGCEMSLIGDERSEQLEIIPAKVYVVVHVKMKYACKGCNETIKQTPPPALPIPKSIAAPGLLANVLVSKFEDHLPLYRQESILERIGVDIPRASLSNWVIKCANLLKPLVNLIQSNILDYDVAFADETTVQVLREVERPPDKKSYMWLFTGGRPGEEGSVYRYAPSRAHQVPLEFFGDYRGYLHCDGFKAYDTLAAKSDITLVGCLYHARRKFMDAEKVSKKSGLAKNAVNIIKQLARIEAQIKDCQPEKIQQVRRERSLPIMNKFKLWLDKQINYVPKESLIGNAIAYTLSQWPKLMVFLDDGRLEISNNRSERSIKPFVIGRKNWLFANSVSGVEAACVIFSLIETCKIHKIQAYDYLHYVLTHIPKANILEDFEALMPQSCKDELVEFSAEKHRLYQEAISV